MVSEEEEKEHPISDKRELPTSIIIKDVPKEIYENIDMKTNFSNMFEQIDPNVRIDFLKGFQRVRVVFTQPEHATAAKLLVEHHEFNGRKMKAYFAQNIKLTKTTHQDEEGHLTLPPLEKQFLISPPTSPPVGWTQSIEMAPVVCDFDLMSRLAAFTIDDKYELHEGVGDEQPSIIVTPAQSTAQPAVPDRASASASPPLSAAKITRPVTPRPP